MLTSLCLRSVGVTLPPFGLQCCSPSNPKKPSEPLVPGAAVPLLPGRASVWQAEVGVLSTIPRTWRLGPAPNSLSPVRNTEFFVRKT